MKDLVRKRLFINLILEIDFEKRWELGRKIHYIKLRYAGENSRMSDKLFSKMHLTVYGTGLLRKKSISLYF